MKKLNLLPLLFFLVLTSCKEDEDQPTPETLKDRLQGTWVTTIQDYKFYDAAGTVVYTEIDETETTFVFDGSYVTATYDIGGGMSGTYTITRNSGKDYINLTQRGQTQKMEVTGITSSSMSWRTEVDNAQYYYNGSHDSDYAVITIDFSKQ